MTTQDEQLFKQHKPLAKHLAFRFSRDGTNALDSHSSESVAFYALWCAIESYDAKKRASLRTYAYACIHRALCDECRRLIGRKSNGNYNQHYGMSVRTRQEKYVPSEFGKYRKISELSLLPDERRDTTELSDEMKWIELQLPEYLRETFRLKLLGLSMREISQRTCSVTQVGNRLKKICEIIADIYDCPERFEEIRKEFCSTVREPHPSKKLFVMRPSKLAYKR